MLVYGTFQMLKPKLEVPQISYLWNIFTVIRNVFILLLCIWVYYCSTDMVSSKAVLFVYLGWRLLTEIRKRQFNAVLCPLLGNTCLLAVVGIHVINPVPPLSILALKLAGICCKGILEELRLIFRNQQFWSRKEKVSKELKINFPLFEV